MPVLEQRPKLVRVALRERPGELLHGRHRALRAVESAGLAKAHWGFRTVVQRQHGSPNARGERSEEEQRDQTGAHLDPGYARGLTHEVNSTSQTIMDARKHLAGLVGQTIYTLAQKRPNRILAIEGQDVVVATEKSPNGEPVPIASVQSALDRLFSDREVVVTVESVGYRSAFIGAVLGTIPGVEILTRPRRVRLRRSASTPTP